MYCLSSKENCSLWMKVFFEIEVCAEAPLYLVDVCLIMCTGACTVAVAVVSTRFGLLGCSNLRILFPLHRLFAIFIVLFRTGASSFGRTSWRGRQTWWCLWRISTNNILQIQPKKGTASRFVRPTFSSRIMLSSAAWSGVARYMYRSFVSLVL